MEKSEIKGQLDEVEKLVERGRKEQALDILDSINWRKIRNVNTLLRASDIYEKADAPEDARELLETAHDRSPIGRMIIYRLALLSLRLGEISEAEEYLDEFIEIAPHDSLKYVIKYQIQKAKNVDAYTLISTLEELKSHDFMEEWAFELACLYRQTSQVDKCINMCDEIILWFGEGPYVEKALELKMIYHPLDKEQEDKYRAFQHSKDNLTEIRPEDSGRNEILSHPITIPRVELSNDRFNTINLQAEIKKNIEEIMHATEAGEITENMEMIKGLVEEIPYLTATGTSGYSLEISPEEDKKEQDAFDNTLRDVFQEYLAVEHDGQYSMKLPEYSEMEEQVAGQMTISEVMEEWEKTRRAAEAALMDAEKRKTEIVKAKALEEANQIMDRLVDVSPRLEAGVAPETLLKEQYLGETLADVNGILQEQIERMQSEEEDTKEAPENQKDEYVSGDTGAIPEVSPEGAQAYEEMQEEAEPAEYAEPAEEAEEALNEPEPVNASEAVFAGAAVIAEEISAEPENAGEGVLAESEINADESRGELEGADEISEAEEEKAMEKMAFPENEPEDIAPEKEAPKRRKAHPRAHMSQYSPRIFGAALKTAEGVIPAFAGAAATAAAVGESAAASALEQSVSAETSVIPEAAAATAAAIVAAAEAIADTGSLAPAAEAVKQDTGPIIVSTEDVFPAIQEMTEPDLGPTEPVTADTIPLPKIEYDPVEFARTREFKGMEAILDEAEKELEARQKQGEQTDADGKEKKAPWAAETSKLTDQQRQILSYFAPVRGMEEALYLAINGAEERIRKKDRSSYGNIMIIGKNGSGRTTLAADLVEIIRMDTGALSGVTGRISGGNLNHKDVRVIYEKISGGCLIIEEAGELNRETAVNLSLLMENDRSGTIVILEERDLGYRRLRAISQKLIEMFTERIEIPDLSIDELVNFGKVYIQEQGYTMDDMAVLALYDKINILQHQGAMSINITTVRNILEDALSHAKDRNSGLFGLLSPRAKDDSGNRILIEKDFV